MNLKDATTYFDHNFFDDRYCVCTRKRRYSNNSSSGQALLLWRRINFVTDLTARWNEIFQWVIAANDATSLAMLCANFYGELKFWKIMPTPSILTYTAHAVMNFLRMLYFNKLCSQLVVESINLQSVVKTKASENWTNIGESDRKAFHMVLAIIQSTPPRATPFGMYSVSPTTLLTMTSIAVTYLIVLLQSPEANFDSTSNCTVPTST
ncbi:hypothetical protein QYM36_000277 [Artemia franciscana]|nr:hypothetical protein QYM36_000277 [Artemia franciscana]